jgi:hypothetical protein
VEPGEELRDVGSGSIVLETGLAMKVTLRAVRGRPVSCRRSGVRSELEFSELIGTFGEEAMAMGAPREELCTMVSRFPSRLIGGHATIRSRRITGSSNLVVVPCEEGRFRRGQLILFGRRMANQGRYVCSMRWELSCRYVPKVR